MRSKRRRCRKGFIQQASTGSQPHAPEEIPFTQKCQEEVTTSRLPSVTQPHIVQVKQEGLSRKEEASRSDQKKALFREKVHENKI